MDTTENPDIPPEKIAAWRVLDPFQDLSDAAWTQVSTLLRTQTVAKGEVIIQAGDAVSEAFVLLRGYAEVVIGETERVVTELTDGALFGEQGLLSGGMRGATVIAREPGELLIISNIAFDIIVRERPDWLTRLIAHGAQQAEASIAAGDSLRALFEPGETSVVESRTFSAGARIVSYGERSDGVYLITGGQLEVTSASGIVLDQAGAGSCIGELGVLLDLPRSATVRAVTHTTALWLKAETFRDCLQDNPLAEQVLRKLWHGYRFERSFVRQFSTPNAEGGRRWTVYGLVDGRTIAVFRSKERAGFQADVAGGVTPGDERTLHWGGTSAAPWLSLTLVDSEGGTQLRRVDATLDRPECSAAFHFLLEDTTVTAEMEDRFFRLGRLEPEVATADVLLCRCMKVPHSVVQEAIDGGLTTLTQVEATTGCGGVCGGCRVRVSLMLANVDTEDKKSFSVTEGPEIAIHVPLVSRWGAKFGRAAAIAVGLWRYVRPGLAVIAFLSLPAMTFVSPTVAIGLAFVAAFVIGTDLLSARRQWREIFEHMIASPVGIGRNEERPGGFAEDGSQAVRSIVMRKLPFRDWIAYKYTLRQVYILNSAARWVRHQLRIRLLRAGFEGARHWGSRSRAFWGEVPREIAELCLETSLCLGMIDARPNEHGQTVGVFRFTDWLCPANLSDGSEIAAVETLEITIDLQTRTALSCCVNGEELGATRHALCWVYLALSAYQHTMLHAYANWAADPLHEDRYVRQGARWTLSTNAVAIYSGNAFQSDARSFQRVARHNSAKSMFRHGAGPMMATIAEYSHFASFMLDARCVFMDVMSKQGIDVDLEALFLMTVVHSLDHHMASVCVDPVDLVPEGTTFHPAQNVRVLFSEPLEPLGLNTRLCSFRRGWPRELYEALHPIDPDLARYVDIGIAY